MSSENSMDARLVAIAEDTGAEYPDAPPYLPSEQYPEFAGRVSVSGNPNSVYPLLRRLFLDLGLDAGNAGTPRWNPLKGLVRPGYRVLVKPNLVRHLHLRGGAYQAVVTHAAVVRAVLDYTALALQGEGEIVVGDAPVQSADFDAILNRTGLQEVCQDVARVWGLPVRIIDFRLWRREGEGAEGRGRSLSGDPAGYRAVDLGSRSLLAQLGEGHRRFRVTSYDCREMANHHNGEVHEYLVPQTVLDADLVINLPKLKTHRKVGLTASLKNLVGVNGHKDWLPHHRSGSVSDGGDEYLHPSKLKEIQSGLEWRVTAAGPWSSSLGALGLRVARRLSRMHGRDPYEEGSWYGNDTLWRTVLDLNRLLRYADRSGRMRETPQRQCLTLVDGILAGEGEGPMEPEARRCGVLVGGVNQAAIDAVLATMVGFDYRKIPVVSKAFSVDDWPVALFPPESIRVSSDSPRWRDLAVGAPCAHYGFVPPSGWRGHIEFEPALEEGCRTRAL